MGHRREYPSEILDWYETDKRHDHLFSTYPTTTDAEIDHNNILVNFYYDAIDMNETFAFDKKDFPNYRAIPYVIAFANWRQRPDVLLYFIRHCCILTQADMLELIKENLQWSDLLEMVEDIPDGNGPPLVDLLNFTQTRQALIQKSKGFTINSLLALLGPPNYHCLQSINHLGIRYIVDPYPCGSKRPHHECTPTFDATDGSLQVTNTKRAKAHTSSVLGKAYGG
jgi:hypothetical protein